MAKGYRTCKFGYFEKLLFDMTNVKMILLSNSYFMCMSLLLVCMSVHHLCAWDLLSEAEAGVELEL